MRIKKKTRSKQRTGLTFGTSMITILVGPTAEKFIMHRDRVCEPSGCFRGLLLGNFNDAADGTTTLKEENVEGFKLFQHCVYNNKFPDKVEDVEEVVGSVGSDDALGGIVRFYVLADQLILEERFKLQAIRTFTTSILPGGIPGGNSCGRLLSALVINPALLFLPEHDPFLKLVIDITAYQYLKRSKKPLGINIYNTPDEATLRTAIRAYEAEMDGWLEECIADVPTGRVVKLFSAVAEFTKGWCMSNWETTKLNSALIKGVDQEYRYAVGFLRKGPGMGLDEMAAADDVKRITLENGAA